MSLRSYLLPWIQIVSICMLSCAFTACGSGDGGGSNDENPVPYSGEGGGDGAAGATNSNPTLASCYQGDSWTCAVEAAIVSETNHLRQKAIAQSFEDSFVAREWSGAQADAGKISHDGFPADRRASLARNFNAKWSVLAENVAMAQTEDEDPLRVARIFVRMWNGSDGHRANMLGNYSYLGAGVVRSGKAVYATQIFH